MLKALIKKQLMEINKFYFWDAKKNKRKSIPNIVMTVVAMLLVYGVLAFMMFSAATALSAPLLEEAEKGSVFFALFAAIALALSTFGSVFQTYSALYLAKDNESLLAMPIPPRRILISRAVGVFAMCLLYTALAWLPPTIVWAIAGGSLLLPLLLLPLLALFSTVVTCALGAPVAAVASRLKKKSFITTLLSVTLMALYYFFIMRSGNWMEALVSSTGALETAFGSVLMPVGIIGQAAAGNGIAALGFAAVTLGLACLCGWILSRSFVKIVTRTPKASLGKDRAIGCRSPKAALLHRELKRFTASPTYMLNTGFGLLALVALTVLALIKSNTLRSLIIMARMALRDMNVEQLCPAALLCVLFFILSTCTISAPSVSLEGKNLWIIRSLPASGKAILSAKRNLHLLIAEPVTLLCSILASYALRLPVASAALVTVAALLYVYLLADTGLLLNLHKPNLTWTSETIPVKQSFAVTLCLLGGWFLSLAIGGLILLAWLNGFPVMACLGILCALLATASVLLNRCISTFGVQRFEAL